MNFLLKKKKNCPRKNYSISFFSNYEHRSNFITETVKQMTLVSFLGVLKTTKKLIYDERK